MTIPTKDSLDSSPTSTPRPLSQSGSRKLHVLAAGIAAAVLILLIAALPTCTEFMHNRQQRALRQAVHVDMTYMLDKQSAFYKAYGFYTTDLNVIGVTPKLLIYKMGFVSPSSHEHQLSEHQVVARELNIRPELKDIDALLAAIPALKIEFSPLTRLETIDISKLGSYCPDCTATPTSFKAIFAANLDADAELDIWTINEKGEREQLVKDIAN